MLLKETFTNLRNSETLFLCTALFQMTEQLNIPFYLQENYFHWKKGSGIGSNNARDSGS